MSIDDLLFVYGVAGLSMAHMMGFHSLLPGGRYSKISYVTMIAVFLFSASTKVMNDSIESMSVLATAAPLVSFWVMHAIRRAFIKKHDRVPMDTAFNYEDGLLKDRIYNIAAAGVPFSLWSVLFGLVYYFQSTS